MRRAPALLASSLVALVSACAADPTQIVVAVYCDLPPSSIDTVELTIASPDTGFSDTVSQSVGGPGDPDFPLTHGLVPSSERTQSVRVTATGKLGATTVVSQQFLTQFVDGSSRLLRLDLTSDCMGSACTSPNTCGPRGDCISEVVTGTALPEWSGEAPGQMPKSPDAGDGGVDASDAGCCGTTCPAPIRSYTAETLTSFTALDACDAGTVVIATGGTFDAAVSLPFPFPLFGDVLCDASVRAEGAIYAARAAGPMADPCGFDLPVAAIMPFWVPGQEPTGGGVCTQEVGGRFAITWHVQRAATVTATFTAILDTDGTVEIQIIEVGAPGTFPTYVSGGDARIGIGTGAEAADVRVPEATACQSAKLEVSGDMATPRAWRFSPVR